MSSAAHTLATSTYSTQTSRLHGILLDLDYKKPEYSMNFAIDDTEYDMCLEAKYDSHKHVEDLFIK